MTRRRSLIAFVALAAWNVAAPAQACCWLFGGGGWGAFRPTPWRSFYYGPPAGCCAPSCCNPCSSGCSPCSSGCSPCGTGCSSCATQSYYVGSDCCGPCSACGTNCGGACGANYSPNTTNPIPEPTYNNSNPTNDRLRQDDFRGGANGTGTGTGTGTGGSSIPGGAGTDGWGSGGRSSIPSNPPASSIPPATNNPPATSIPPGAGRGIEDNRSTDPFPGGGGDAPTFFPPRTIPEVNPTDPQDFTPSDSKVLQIQPLDLNSPIAASYRVSRQRVRLDVGSDIPQTPAQIARPSNAAQPTNDGWVPVRGREHVASR